MPAQMDIGGPQFAAAGLLLLYLIQCVWLVHLESRTQAPADSAHTLVIYYGLQQWKTGTVAGTPDSFQSEAATGMPSTAWAGHLRVRDGYDQDRSPLHYLIAAAPFLIIPRSVTSPTWHLLASIPYLFFGVMLGGSLWYVSRRLYGNAGGYIALTLYCFSPAMIANAAGWSASADMGAIWGAFGAVFTGIAVAHTLYAPREVILWNWRRTLLLGLSLVLAVGNQFSFVAMAILALLFMLWVAPVRRGAVLAIWSTACALALLIMFASYFFDVYLYLHGLSHARWLDFEPRAFTMRISYLRIWHTLVGGSPALVLALPACVMVFLLWRRTRYFGNLAPLLAAGVLLFLGLNTPEFSGTPFPISAITFLFVFVAGVLADLLETRYGPFVTASVTGLLTASAIWNILQLVLNT